MAIYQAVLTFGGGTKLNLFAETVGESFDVSYTPSHTIDVRNDGSGVVRLGNSSVTAGSLPSGHALRAGQSFRLSLHSGDALYAINESDTSSAANIDVVIVLD